MRGSIYGPVASLGLMRMMKAIADRLEGLPRQFRRFSSKEFRPKAVEQAC